MTRFARASGNTTSTAGRKRPGSTPEPWRDLAESVAAELEIPFLGVDLLETGEKLVINETNARPTIDEETKYEPEFYDRLAAAIRDVAD